MIYNIALLIIVGQACVSSAGSLGPSDSYCICTLEYAPICGSDGITYPNKCALRCEQSKGQDISIVKRGECDDISNDRVKREGVGKNNCVCTREAKPVCGTDGKTYSNPCMLNCARNGNEDLQLDHSGPCAGSARRSVPASCACTRHLEPVCASNGVTYSNPCLMRCADPTLAMVKHEPCEFA